MVTSDINGRSQLPLPLFEILTEVAPGEGCFGHIPALPGLCFRAYDPAELERMAPGQIVEYAEWLLAENLVDLNPVVAALVHQVLVGNFGAIRVVETERREGSPLWISGNPAVLFDYDLHLLDDPAVTAHLRFTRKVVHRIQAMVVALSQEQRAQKSMHEHRSVDDTLTHIGNCVWWYCSRIDNGLPEPDERVEETPLLRIERLLDIATKYLLAVPLSERTTVHVPTRFLTKDPQESWTHTKVCRRQAEHVWEHLNQLRQAVRLTRKS